jgi:hypothetical protein
MIPRRLEEYRRREKSVGKVEKGDSEVIVMVPRAGAGPPADSATFKAVLTLKHSYRMRGVVCYGMTINYHMILTICEWRSCKTIVGSLFRLRRAAKCTREEEVASAPEMRFFDGA